MSSDNQAVTSKSTVSFQALKLPFRIFCLSKASEIIQKCSKNRPHTGHRDLMNCLTVRPRLDAPVGFFVRAPHRPRFAYQPRPRGLRCDPADLIVRLDVTVTPYVGPSQTVRPRRKSFKARARPGLLSSCRATGCSSADCY